LLKRTAPTSTRSSTVSPGLSRAAAPPLSDAAAAAIPLILLAYVVRSAGDFCGFGIRYKKMSFDYAFIPLGDLGITHHLSIN